jgi:Nup133 N terminal like
LSQLVLLGVCCGSSGDGMDPYAELALQPLPEYRIPCDGAEAVCITSTVSGRIFMAARDGQIYELFYTNGSGWQKRFRSVCMTSSLLMRYICCHHIFLMFRGSLGCLCLLTDWGYISELYVGGYLM